MVDPDEQSHLLAASSSSSVPHPSRLRVRSVTHPSILHDYHRRPEPTADDVVEDSRPWWALLQDMAEHVREISTQIGTFEPLEIDQIYGSVRSSSAAGSASIMDEYVDEPRHGKARSNSSLSNEIGTRESVTDEKRDDIADDSSEHLVYPQIVAAHDHDPLAPFVHPELPGHHHEKLGVLPLAVMIFYSVSGGPFGCEPSVRAAGNYYTLLGFIIAPFVWSIPEALLTAELGTTFPEASGGVAWVEEAFGTNAGWMCGYLGWVAGATDNAIYPVLFLDYLFQAMHLGKDSIPTLLRFVLLSSTSITLGYINWLGLPLVGKMSLTICFIAMSPFIILTLVGSWKIDPARWFELPTAAIPIDNQTSDFNITDATAAVTDDDDVDAPTSGFLPEIVLGGVLWRPFLNNLFWNLNSFDAGASKLQIGDGCWCILIRCQHCSRFQFMYCYSCKVLLVILKIPVLCYHEPWSWRWAWLLLAI
jgi:Amino acid permease